jgi:hypothetical protein
MASKTLIGQIIDDLTQHPSTNYEQAERNAKVAFLAWAVSLPEDVDIQQAAQAALIAIDGLKHSTVAIDLFKSYLEEATQALPKPLRQGGSRKRSRSH